MSPNSSATRRTARTRSRNGCRQCVKVSRKCDEAHPACGRCQRLSFECDYSPRWKWKTSSTKDNDNLGALPQNHMDNAASSLSRAVNVTENPVCSCSNRPTRNELVDLFMAEGHNLLHWTDPANDAVGQTKADIMTLYRLYPAIASNIDALMSTWGDCCEVSSLSRVKSAISETMQLINSPASTRSVTTCTFAMTLMSQVSMWAGYIWTPCLEQILSLVLSAQPGSSDSRGPSRKQLLERLGGLDIDIWIVGRRSKPLHIWATHCSGGEGVEEITGLPRPLLDIFARLSQNENVEEQLVNFIRRLPLGNNDTKTDIWHCYSMAALLRQYELLKSWEKVGAYTQELLGLVRRVHPGLERHNSRVLIWPAYMLGRHVKDANDLKLVHHILSRVHCQPQPGRYWNLHATSLGVMQTYWDIRKRTQNEAEIDTLLHERVVEVGLW